VMELSVMCAPSKMTFHVINYMFVNLVKTTSIYMFYFPFFVYTDI
jgi:hypothetical protein